MARYVYLAMARSNSTKPMKIGRTWNLKLRQAQLRRQRKSTTIKRFIRVEVDYRACDLEKHLHGIARRSLKYRGDWHEAHNEVLEYFAANGECYHG